MLTKRSFLITQRSAVLMLACLSAAGMLFTAGCGNKSDEGTDAASPAAAGAGATVPPQAAQQAAGQQAAGQQRGMDEAAKAAAYNAARAKAEGR